MVDWVKARKKRLVRDLEVDPDLVRDVIDRGYAPDLTEDELEKIGCDPFLVAHALAIGGPDVTVVTTEVSKPGARRANRRLPDVCVTHGIRCVNTFRFVRELDFSTGWNRG